MSQDGFLYNLMSTFSPWRSSNASIDLSESKDITDHAPSNVATENASFTQKVSSMVSEYYKSYYKSDQKVEDLSMNSNVTPMKNSTDVKLSHNSSSGMLMFGLSKKLNGEDKIVVPNDLLSEIKNAGGLSKLNKVVVIREEKKSDHDLTAVLSSALNARKNVIMDPEVDEDESEWDDK